MKLRQGAFDDRSGAVEECPLGAEGLWADHRVVHLGPELHRGGPESHRLGQIETDRHTVQRSSLAASQSMEMVEPMPTDHALGKE